MRHRYDPATQHAEQRLADLEKRPVRKEAALAAFMARSSGSAVVRDRDAGLHRIHAQGPDGAICTCALIVDPDGEDVLRLPGHLDPGTGRPVHLLLGYATEPLRGCFPTYEAYCQRCGWSARGGKVRTLQKALQAHATACPAALRAVPNL